MLLLGILISVSLSFILLSAFFSASETALFSIPRERLIAFADHHKRSYRQVYLLLKHGQQTLLMLLLGNIFVNITLTGLINSVIEQLLHHSSPLLTLLVATVIVVVFAEIIPKNFALKNNEFVANFIAPYLSFIIVISRPFLKTIESVNRFFLNIFKERLRNPAPFVTIEELKTGIVESMQKGAIEEREKQILVSILDEGALPVRKLMVHRSNVVTLPSNLSVRAGIQELSFKRQLFGVMHNPKNNQMVTGIFRLSSLLKSKPDNRLWAVAMKPVWVPETLEIAGCVSYLFNEGLTEVCVLDQFGSFAGVFSLNDGLRGLLSSNPGEPLKKEISGRSKLFYGMHEVETMRDWLPPELSLRAFEGRTLNGLLTDHLGRIPKAGEQFAISGWNFYIIAAGPTRIESVLIRKKEV